MIPARWRQVRMNSQSIAVLGAALVVIVLWLQFGME